MDRKLVHIVTDYQQGGLGAANLYASVLSSLPAGWDVLSSSVFNFDTISTGYLVGQLALRHEDLRPEEMMILAYCAPRVERPRDNEGNEAHAYLFARLHNSVGIVALNAGHALSFVRGNIKELRGLNLQGRTPSLRPNDYLPKVVGEIVQGNLDCLGDEVDPQKVIPDCPQGVICYIDNFGNIKTTYRDHDDVIRHVKSLGSGARIRVEINGEVRAAILPSGAIDLMEGDMIFGPEKAPYLNRIWEISCRRGDAAAVFNNPPPGSAIKLIIHQK